MEKYGEHNSLDYRYLEYIVDTVSERMQHHQRDLKPVRGFSELKTAGGWARGLT